MPAHGATAREGIKALIALGFHKPGDVENRLGYYLGQIARWAGAVIVLLGDALHFHRAKSGEYATQTRSDSAKALGFLSN
jgi:hypothetical protein